MTDRKNEFDQKIGEKEDEYCGKCGKTTSQRWTSSKYTWGFTGERYTYYLRCKECGNETQMYRVEY